MSNGSLVRRKGRINVPAPKFVTNRPSQTCVNSVGISISRSESPFTLDSVCFRVQYILETTLMVDYQLITN